MVSDNVTDEELSGLVVDRRTTLKLLGTTAMAGLAGCAGGGGDGGGSNGSGGGNRTSGTGSSSQPKGGGRLKAGWYTGSVDNLDPSYITIGVNAQVMANVFNALVQVTSGLRVVPDLARDWTVEDKTKYTFDLRENVTFHNGAEFTAEDVKFTVDRIITDETPIASKLEPLKPIDQGGVVVVDDYTVELNFKQPYAPALSTIARGDGRGSTIVSQQAIEEMGEEQYEVALVGTGPFEVARHDVGSIIELDAFGDYFGTDEQGNQLPYLDGIDIQPIPEASTMVNALRSGDVQFANELPLANLSQVEEASGVRAGSGPGGGWTGLGMNEKREPFGSRKVRRGIAKAVNSEQFVQDALFGNAHIAAGPIAPAHDWAFREDKANDQAYAPEEGKRLLREAGAYGASFDILTMQRDIRPAKVMRQQLNEAGFDVGIEQVTTSTYRERYEKREYDTTVAGNAVDLDPDPALYLFSYSRGEGGVFNWVNYDSEEANGFMKKQRRLVEQSARKPVLHDLEDLIVADAPHAYTHHPKPYFAISEDVKGYKPHPVNRDFHTVWLDS